MTSVRGVLRTWYKEIAGSKVAESEREDRSRRGIRRFVGRRFGKIPELAEKGSGSEDPA
jgi:hypothetical protein